MLFGLQELGLPIPTKPARDGSRPEAAATMADAEITPELP
jgi:hypothetical protein